MKNKELLARCCAIRGESGVKGVFEGGGVVWQHAAHVTCQQKQSVARTWHRHAPDMGTKMENRGDSRKPEQSLQQKRGEKIYIHQVPL